MDRNETIEIDVTIPDEAWPDPPTERVVPVVAADVDLARAGSDTGIDEAIGFLPDEDVTEEEGGAP